MRIHGFWVGPLLAVAIVFSGNAIAGGGEGGRGDETVVRDIIGWDPKDWQRFRRWRQQRQERQRQDRQDEAQTQQSPAYETADPRAMYSAFAGAASSLAP